MHKYFLFFLIIIGSCQKEENKQNDDAFIDEQEFNQSQISKQLDRNKIDSILVTTNIFEISYNEIFEQPISSNAKYKTAAVTPDPQVVII